MLYHPARCRRARWEGPSPSLASPYPISPPSPWAGLLPFSWPSLWSVSALKYHELTSLLQLDAAFLLFPSTVEVAVNSPVGTVETENIIPFGRKPRSLPDDGEGKKGILINAKKWKEQRETFERNKTFSLNPGFCTNSSNPLCQLFTTTSTEVSFSIRQPMMSSQDCLEAASCEVAALTTSTSFPVMARIVAPLLSSNYYDR